MKTLLVLLFLLNLDCFGADDEASRLRRVAKGLDKGDPEALTELNGIHSERAGRLILDSISNQRIDGGTKFRLAEIVADWPKVAPGRQTLLDWVAKNKNCGDDELQFLSEIHLPETRSLFWSEIEKGKGEPAKIKQSHRIAMAARGLGHFEDNPEVVVTRISSFLHEDHVHVIRSSAADALGGMRSLKAIEALIPQVEDPAIGTHVARSLYRLTGMHFDQDPPRQWADWLAANSGKIEVKALTAGDFESFLKMQSLVKPEDAAVVNMNTFYGIDLRGKGLLFILDVSGSMAAQARIEKLRTQMENILVVLESRSEKMRFDIITFGSSVDSCFRRGIMENTLESRKVAARFIKNLDADGGTPMIEALTYAHEIVLPEGNIDTIFFLSDGAPGDGTPEMVLEITRRMHQRYRTRFNTISIGEDSSPALGETSLLQKMAEITGGTFTKPDELKN